MMEVLQDFNRVKREGETAMVMAMAMAMAMSMVGLMWDGE